MAVTRRWLLSVTVIAGFTSTVVAQDTNAPPAPAGAAIGHRTIPVEPMEPPFAALRQIWAQCLHGKSVDAITALYTADGVFLDPSGRRFAGRSAIKDLMRKVMQAFDSTIQLTSLSSERSGALAYDSGTFTETLVDRSTGVTSHTSGSYLQILRRGDDGRWRIAQQVWTGTEPRRQDGKAATG